MPDVRRLDPVASAVVVSQDAPAARGGYGDWPV